jgi:signal transduction histidine kinase
MIRTQRRLTHKLLLLLALPPLLGVSGLGLLTSYDRRQELLAEADRELMDHATSLGSTLPLIAASTDRAHLASTVEGIARLERVHGIALYDAECRAIARSRDLSASAAEVDRLACAGERPEAAEAITLGGNEVLVRVVRVDGSQHVSALLVTYRLEEVERIIWSGALRMAVAGALLAALMAGVAVMLARAAARSLGDMVNAAGQIAAGDLSVRVAASEYLELGRLGRSFNEMTEALERSRRELEQAAARHREMERRLLHAQGLRVVGQVAASLAHEVASPLSTILGWSRLAAGEEQLPGWFREQAGVVAAQCERITRIVQRMLTVARPAEGEREAVSLAAVAQEVQDFLQGECRRRGVQQEVEGGAEVGTVQAERDRCLQIVMNLCVNAIQAQPRGGRLVVGLQGVTLAEGGEGVALEVRDAGPGVPAERRASIFEPFYSTKAAKEGMGLGLSIVREIVTEMGGTVEVRDAAEGGACFRVVLPRDPEGARAKGEQGAVLTGTGGCGR